MSMGSQRDALIGHFLKTGIRQASVTVLNLISTIFIAKLLGPENMGFLATLMVSTGLIATVFSFGFSSGLVYYLPQGGVDVRHATDVTHVISFGTLILVIFCGFFFYLSDFVSEPLLAGFLALQIFFICCRTNYTGLLLGLRRYNEMNLISLIGAVLKSLLVISFYLSGVTISVSLALFVYLCDDFICLMLIFFRHLPRRIPSFQEGRDVVLKCVAYGWQVHFSNFVLSLLYRADIYLLQAFSGLGQAGIYNFALQVSEKSWLPSQAMSTIMLPEFVAEKSRVHIEEGLRKILWLSAIGTTVLASIAPLGIYILVNFVGKGFWESVEVSFWLIPGMVAMGVGRIYMNFLASQGRPLANIKIILFSLFVNVVLDLFLIPRYGAVGAAIGSSLAYCCFWMLSRRKASRFLAESQL
ncbi:MAG: polysaccharide biosynthesis C-terminal domain-containing protein [Bdellovibrionaceae bacterium]|nr:polysaccharide biosynthesis C-terminal domain-containing protein [Pseudobdellovibrionaceae bacterium]